MISFYQKDDYDDILEKGIMKTKILLAEKFVPVQFLIPLPSFNFSMKSDVEKMLSKLQAMWNLPAVSYKRDFSTSFNTNSTPYNINWILNQTTHQIEKSRQEVSLMRNETATFLQTESDEQKRGKRGAHVGALAMAGIGLLGSGIVMGSAGGCGATGIFGSCQDEAKAKAQNIEQLNIYLEALTEYVVQKKKRQAINFS